MSDKGNTLELTSLYGRGNEASLHPESNAVPKDVAGRKQSSSKKFKIESVAAQDDPLYNANAASASGTLPSRKPSMETTLGEMPRPPAYSTVASDSPTRTDPEGTGGQSVFESTEDLTRKPRTFSTLSTGSQKYYSIENLDGSPVQAEQCNGATTSLVAAHQPSQEQLSEVDSPTSVEDDAFVEADENFARPSKPLTCRRSAGANQLRIDDSFYKKATVEMRVDSASTPSPSSVTNIFVPVPEKPNGPSQDDLHETITSAYETNISINKLLRERHKGSLAAMGRFFGTKQKELEKQQSAASLISAAVVQKKKKKRCYHYLKPIHFCLLVTFIIILSATLTTLITIESTRHLQFTSQGYHLDYKTRELSIYEMSETAQITSHADTLFKANLGVNIPAGLPYNCTQSSEVSCYKWHNTSTVTLSAKPKANNSFCLDVEWSTEKYDPVLEDCIDLSTTDYGYWYGGHLNRSKLSLGRENLEVTTYLPGKRLGPIAERIWLSTNGIAVVAKHDFPLHVRIDAAGKKLCLSSWYGHHLGQRKLSYSLCRSSDHRQAHKLVLKEFYDAYAARHIHDTQILYKPIYSVSGDTECRQLMAKPNLTYSYIINTGVQHSVLGNTHGGPSIGCGMNISPFVPLTDKINMSSSAWLTSTDMDVPRLFNVDGVPHLLLNASATNLTTTVVKSPSNESENTFVFLTNLASGDIYGQEYYALNESVTTFQPYISNILTFTSSNHITVMSSVVSTAQTSSIITYLPSTEDISERIRQVLHSSLTGYNLINPGEISSSLSDNLLIRTLQLSTFMPVIQLPSAVLKQMEKPEVVDVWDKCMEFRRYKNLAKRIGKFLVQGGNEYPLYAPVWWKQNLFSYEASDIVDQFIFDNQYLVAPVVNASATSRHVYFPPGYWLRLPFPVRVDRSIDKGLYKGNQTLEIDVALDEVLVFEHADY